jgi:hypothetical protein
MAEPRPLEDEATLYVLGRLRRAERRKFQARMKASSELRALVRDLEAGTVALALAMPQREAPPQAWENVKDAVAREVKARAFFVRWIRSGWAAAACVLIGWLVYALWIHRSLEEVSPPGLSAEMVQREPDPGVIANPDMPRTLRQPHNPSNVASPKATSLARIGEIATLRRQLRDLEDQVAHMSQVMTQQQQTFPSEPGQLAFFQLAPVAPDGATGRVVKPPSPELQRALLIGMARELGWLRPSAAAQPSANPEKKETKPETQQPALAPGPASAPASADLGVNFVDLPPEGAGQSPTAPTLGAEEAKKLKSILAEPTASSPETATTTESLEAAIPILRSETTLILALDSSVLPFPATNPVTVWTAPQNRAGTGGSMATSLSEPPGSALIARGTFTLGNSATVLTIPWGNSSANSLSPIVFTTGGATNPGGPGVVRFAPVQ